MPCWLDCDLGARRRVVGWCRFSLGSFGWGSFGWGSFGWGSFGWGSFGWGSFGWGSFGWGSFKRRLDWCLKGFTSVTTRFHQFGLQTIQNRSLDKFTIKRNGAHRVIIARNEIINTIRIGVAINNRHNRNAKTIGFLNSDGLFICIEDKQHIRNAAHFLDSAKRTLKLFLLTSDLECFFFGQLVDFTAFKAAFKLTQTAN
jgi:hypothetical protein